MADHRTRQDSDGYTAIELADASEKSEVVDFLRSL